MLALTFSRVSISGSYGGSGEALPGRGQGAEEELRETDAREAPADRETQPARAAAQGYFLIPSRAPDKHA